MNWEPVIGLEVHVQLATQSKLFSSADVAFGAEPNVQACEVDLGLPGTLPVVNREVIRMAIRFGLAIDAEINTASVFARKHYFYPDLPKGYQISQYDKPIVANGELVVVENGKQTTIGVTRAHLEEDAGKSVHNYLHGQSAIDLNRAGTPLLEIVSDPVIYSVDQAIAYLKEMHRLVQYLGISDGDMSQGSMRCDANISLREAGSDTLGVRVEIKNLNSFRFVHKALQYEIKRQTMLLDDGGEVQQETRLYDSDKDVTRSMRGKEEAQDYRYFPDPDLPTVVIDERQIADERTAMPELPWEKYKRYIEELKLPVNSVEVLVDDPHCAGFFDSLVQQGCQPKLASSWVTGEISAALNNESLSFQQCPVSPEKIAQLLEILGNSTINGATAKQIFARLLEQPDLDIAAYVEEKGLSQLSDTSELETMVKDVIGNNQPQVQQYLSSPPEKQKKMSGFFVGKIMQASKGRANPALVQQLLGKYLQSSD